MSDSLDHLAPECQDEARLETKDRVRAILTERWISYPRANFAIQKAWGFASISAARPHALPPSLWADRNGEDENTEEIHPRPRAYV